MKVVIESPFQMMDQAKREIESSVSDLSKYQSSMTKGNVYFKKDDGNLPDSITAEVELHVPGPVIFASDNAENYMDAFRSAVNKAERQLRKAKDIRTEHR